MDAGRQLAEELLWIKDVAKDNVASDIVVLDIPCRGVIVGDHIASPIGATLDIVVPRKIGAPFIAEFAIGAIMPDGICFLNAGNVEACQVPEEYIATHEKEQIKEINRRLEAYRGHKSMITSWREKLLFSLTTGLRQAQPSLLQLNG